METTFVDQTLENIRLKEKQAKKRAIVLTLIPLLAAIFLVYFTSKKVLKAQRQVTEMSAALDSIKTLRDSFQLEYLSAKGFDKSKKYELLNESIKANNLLSKLLEKNKIDSTLEIKYYRKSLDEQKVWLSLKELGYIHMTDIQTKDSILNRIETNGVVVGNNVSLNDLKIILLTLIRAGFKIQHVEKFENKPNSDRLIQILSITPADGSPDKTLPLPVNKIQTATNKDQFFTTHFSKDKEGF